MGRRMASPPPPAGAARVGIASTFRAGRLFRVALAVTALGLAIRLGAAVTAPIWFDEATVGLMGRHVLRGDFPWFFYGQTFMGAAEAYLHAIPFALWGASETTLRLWPVTLSLVHAALVGLLARRLFGMGRFAALLAIVPPPFLLKWAYDARLHYDAILVFTPLLLLLGLVVLDAARTPAERSRALLVFAVVAGIGWWINLLLSLLPAALAVALLLVRPRLHPSAWAAPLGFLAGSAPFWLFSLAHGRLALGTARLVSAPDLADHGRELVLHALPIVLGLPARWLPGLPRPGLAVAGVGLVLAAAVVALGDRRARAGGRLLLATLVALTVASVLATEHGRNLATEDPRYLLPLVAVLPVLVGGALARLHRVSPVVAGAAALLLVLSNGAGLITRYSFLVSPARWQAYRLSVLGPAQRVAFMRARGLTALYTHDPDVLTFVSGERASVSHFYLESYPPLARHVDGAERVAYFSQDPPAGFAESLTAAGIRFARMRSPLGTLYTEFTLEHADYREIPRERLVATASDRPRSAAHALDRDAATRWDSGGPARAGTWFQVDLGRIHPIGMLAWLPGGFQEVPAGFRVEASADGEAWTTVREAAPYYGPLYWSGAHPLGRVRWGRVEVRFPSIWARHLRITHLGEQQRFPWSIRELSVYEALPALTAVRPADVGATAAALRRAGIERVYADHGVGARLAAAAGQALALQPANLRVDAYGWSPAPNELPLFRPHADTALVHPVGLASAESIQAMLRDAGWTFAVEEVGGHRILSRFTPGALPAGGSAPRIARVVASTAGADAAAVLDGQPATRWTTAGPQRPGAWLRVELAEPARVAGLVLELGPFRTDYPRGLVVESSADGLGWDPVRADLLLLGPLRWTGTHLLRDGVDRVLLRFVPRRTRALRLTLTGQDPVFDWSVAELRLFGG